jgi:hypothetical protein
MEAVRWVEAWTDKESYSKGSRACLEGVHVQQNYVDKVGL